MKPAHVRSLSQHLLPHMPGYVQQRNLLLAAPVGHVLRAFCFEDSSFDASVFYLSVFFMPLYVSSSHIHFGFGKRLRHRGIEGWNLGSPRLADELLGCILREGLPFL